MTTRLDRELKRAVTVKGEEYKLTLDPLGLKITPRGKRKGVTFTWQSLLGGDKALAAALNASLRNPTKN